MWKDLGNVMLPPKLILRSFFYSCLKDSLKKPKKKLFSTSERNIASYLRSSLEIFKNFHRSLLFYQVDTEYNRVGIKSTSKKIDYKEGKKLRVIPDIIVHKRGETVKDGKDVNYLCIEIKKIRNFNGDLNSIKNREMRRRLEDDLEKLKFLRRNKNYKYIYGISVVISDPHTIFFKINDEDFVRCSIQEVPAQKKKKFTELVDRVIFITKDRDFSEKVTYQAKVKEYEKEIDQIIESCLV